MALEYSAREIKRCCFPPLLQSSKEQHLPGTLWGFGAGWFGPPSSETPGLLSAPRGESLPGRCPSAGPSDSPVPPPGAGSGREGRGGLARAPPRGSAAGLAYAGCGRLHPGGGSFLRNLQETGEEVLHYGPNTDAFHLCNNATDTSAL